MFQSHAVFSPTVHPMLFHDWLKSFVPRASVISRRRVADIRCLPRQCGVRHAVATLRSTEQLEDRTLLSSVTVDVLTTSNTTPTLTGSYAEDGGGVDVPTITVTVNGSDYAAVLNPGGAGSAGTWTADVTAVLGEATYDVSAALIESTSATVNDASTNELTIDTTAPSTTSFTRKTPPTNPTNSDTLVFLATFSEGVTGVEMNDFAVNGTTATISVSQLTASTYDVTVSGGDLASLNGTVGLNFNSPSIMDLAGNALPSTEPGTDETYVVDNAGPTPNANTGLTVNEGQVAAPMSPSELEFTDTNSGASDVTYTLDSVPTNGTLYLDANSNNQPDGAAEILVASETFTQADINAGLLKYDHDGGDVAGESLQFDVTDALGNATNDQTFSITVRPADTEITLSGGVLTITDVEGGDSADQLTISYSGGTYTITDAGGLNIDASSISGSAGNGSSSVTVPDTGVTAITINVLGGDDTVTVNSVQAALSGDFTISAIDGSDSITISGPITTGGGAVNLQASNGVTLSGANADITTSGGAVTIDADADDDGTGTFTSNDAGSEINSTDAGGDGAISVTAADVEMAGTINVGAAQVTLTTSVNGAPLYLGAASSAAEIIVTTFDDVFDATDFSSAAALEASPGADGKISLREAANVAFKTAQSGSPVHVTAVLSAGTYTLTIPGYQSMTQTDLGLGGLGTLLTVQGAGADQTVIDADGNFNHFRISDGDVLNVADVELANGGGNTFRIDRGATVSVERTRVTGDSSRVFYMQGSGSEGATLTVTDSEFSDNATVIMIEEGHATFTNSTFSGNTNNVFWDNVGASTSASTLTLVNSTVTGNTSRGLLVYSSSNLSVDLQNTIVANNSAGDIIGSKIVTGSYNVIGNASNAGGLTDGVNGNIVGNSGSGTIDISTILDTTLSDNGGPTKTHALVSGSPAIDAGDPTSLLTTDQRGYDRPVNAVVDIGAYEFNATAPGGGSGGSGGGTGATFTLTDAELDGITTSGTLQIGDSNSGDVRITEAISPSGATSLSLTTGGSVNDAGTFDALTIANLLIDAAGGIGTTGTLNIAASSLDADGGSGGINVRNIGDLSVSAMTSGSASITATGSITVAAAGIDLTAGSGTLSLDAAGTITASGDLMRRPST